MHPLLALLATKPHLLLEHAQAYAALFQEELCLACQVWLRTFVWQVLAVCFLGVAAVLAGVAVLLWAVTPAGVIQVPWLLFATPLLPLAGATGCAVLARRQFKHAAFAAVAQQLSADMALLNRVSRP